MERIAREEEIEKDKPKNFKIPEGKETMKKMKKLVVFCCLAVFVAFLATTMTGCQPCRDPSQLWCPNEW